MNGSLPAPTGPLTGITVVASTVQIAGNFAAMLLGLYGARVIHVEAPGGSDPVRALGGPRKMIDGRAAWQKFVHANMLQVTVNLKLDRGKEVFRRLLGRAHVLIENNRPGMMDRMGLSDAEIQRISPSLVITHVSGYGRTGPLAGQPGYGTALGALSGYPTINGHPGTGPTFLGTSFEDLMAGWAASHATLAALTRARTSGEGAVVDTSLFEPVFFTMMADVMMAYRALGHVPALAGNTLDYASPRGVYRSRDGRSLALSASSQPVWERLAHAIGRPDLISDPRFADNAARVANAAALDAILGPWFSARDAEETLRILGDKDVGVPCEPILGVAEIFDHPHYRARQAFKAVPDAELGELVMPTAPARISTGGEVAFAGQAAGIHTGEVLAEIGYSAEEIDALRREGAI